MRLLYTAVVCIVGISGTLIGYWLAKPDAAHVNSADPAISQHHDHGSHSGSEIAAENSSLSDWCAEHWVPESECSICDPALVERFKSSGNWCAEHNLPESHCRRCNPRLAFAQEPESEPTPTADNAGGVSVFYPPNEAGCTNDKALIQFASSETAERSGISVLPVVQTRASNNIEAPAEIRFDETRVRALSTTVSATVVRWLVNPGQHTEAGQPLAELESPEIVEWLADYLNAHADWHVDSLTLRRAAELRKSNLISDAEWQDTQAHALSSQSRLAGAIGKLRSAGMSTDDIEQVASSRQVSARFELKAITGCTVIERRAPLGELLPPGSTLALVGDGSSLWIEAHIRQQDMGNFRLGDRVQFSSDGQALAHAEGIVIWIADYLDPATRTGLVRAKVVTTSTGLAASLFGRMIAAETSVQSALLVPKDAVQWEGCCNIVFVQEADNRYRPHKVAIARGDNGHYAVLSGLRTGDMVVTDGSFFLKTELLKEKLGVGCTGE